MVSKFYVLILTIFWKKGGNYSRGDIIQGRMLVKKIRYHTCAIIPRSLYSFYPLFEVQKRFFKGLVLKILALCMVSIQERVMMVPAHMVMNNEKNLVFVVIFTAYVCLLPNVLSLCALPILGSLFSCFA